MSPAVERMIPALKGMFDFDDEIFLVFQGSADAFITTGQGIAINKVFKKEEMNELVESMYETKPSRVYLVAYCPDKEKGTKALEHVALNLVPFEVREALWTNGEDFGRWGGRNKTQSVPEMSEDDKQKMMKMAGKAVPTQETHEHAELQRDLVERLRSLNKVAGYRAARQFAKEVILPADHDRMHKECVAYLEVFPPMRQGSWHSITQETSCRASTYWSYVAVSAAPEFAHHAWRIVAYAHWGNHNKEEALNALRKVLKADPEDEDAQRWMRKLLNNEPWEGEEHG